MKLVILSPNLHLIFSATQKEALEENFEVEYFTTPTPLWDVASLQTEDEKIVAIDPDFCDWKVTKGDLEKMKSVKAICLQTTAFHYLDCEYLKERNIPVTNLRWFSTNAVAEQAFAMIFALARKIPMVLREGCVVNFERYRGIELKDKNLGIVWLWRIGSRVGEIGNALGMNIQYWSRNTRNDNYRYVGLDELFSTSDVLVFALAKNEETKNIITDSLLAKLPKHSLLVTIAHLDHPKFVKLAEEWKIAWYACDEMIGTLEDFHSNILPWAELWWCTDECFKRNGEQWIEAIMGAKEGKFPNRVN